jgi:hypothetical protein
VKTIIAGSRNIEDYDLLCRLIAESGFDITEVVSGKCPTGVDALGERWALENGVPVIPFYADWKKYGRAAGPKRNDAMSKYADSLIYIWDLKSRGTRNMINLAIKRDLQIYPPVEGIQQWL